MRRWRTEESGRRKRRRLLPVDVHIHCRYPCDAVRLDRHIVIYVLAKQLQESRQVLHAS